MSGHPAVAFLTAALARAEETAKVATAGPWWVEDTSPRRWGDERDAEVASAKGRLAVLPYDKSGGLNAEHVALHDPAAVMRRVAADRQILAEHARVAWGVFCLRCAEDGGPERGPAAYPCRTVLLLAQAWGWTEETT